MERPDEQVTACLQTVLTSLQPVLQGIEALEQAAPAALSGSSSGVVVNESDELLLKQLKQSLASSDTAAEEQITALLQQATDPQLKSLLADVQSALDAYDFEQASALLSQLPGQEDK